MRLTLLVTLALALPACSLLNSAEDAESLFDKLEFKDGQEGCIRVSGQLNVGGTPFASTVVNVNMVKKQGEEAPDC